MIVTGELQFKQLQKRSLKKFWPEQDLNLCLPDTSWVLLPTELLIQLLMHTELDKGGKFLKKLWCCFGRRV